MSLKQIFLEESTLKTHLDKQNNDYDNYISTFILLTKKYKTRFTINKKAQILSTAIQRNDNILSSYLLNDYHTFNLPVILKTCSILDSRRYYNSLNNKLKTLKNKKRIAKHKSIMANIKTLNEDLHLSLTTSKSKFIKNNWIKNIPKEDLEFNIIQFPPVLWKKIIDLLHLKPSDFQLDWFTKYVFEGVYPENSIVAECSNINENNIIDIISKHKLPFGYLKANHKNLLNDDVFKVMASYLPLNEIITDWDMFNKPNILEIIMHRMEKEKLNMPYGELMKRLQSFHKNKDVNEHILNKLLSIASTELNTYDIKIEQPVVIFGDASPSMDIAIKTSGIITSILCSVCNAKMHLFRSDDEIIDNLPKNVEDVIKINETFKTGGLTAPSISLYPYLQNKEIVKTFIVVTDEIENVGYDGEWFGDNYSDKSFASVYKEYRETVYPAKLVFVSFLENNKDGRMISELKHKISGIENDIIQFRLNSKKPDLRKLDALLDMLTMETGFFENEVSDLKNLIQKYRNDDKLTVANKYFTNNSKELYEPKKIHIVV